ncbi:hypothetical protein AcV7_004788 [Taiwanofungus camphoratus]|nr:hypothetical protein AcV7_004788 [Antrodia cinnamomea]
MPTMNSTKEQAAQAIHHIINCMMKQIVEQVQLAFEEFRNQKIIYVMCIVGIHFNVIKFHRDRTPGFGEYTNKLFTEIPISESSVEKVFKDDMSDLTAKFKSYWTRIKNFQRARA